MTPIERVNLWRELHESVGAVEHRMAHTTADAMALARSLDANVLTHAEKAIAAVKSFEELAVSELPKEEAKLLAYLKARERARADFWDAFEGQVVNGVEIVRRAGL